MDINKLLISIKSHEGLRLKPYTDTTGNITIGYGTKLAAGITFPEASFLLNNRIQVAILALRKQPWFQNLSDDDVRSRALVEMAFNLGVDGLCKFEIALACLTKGDYVGAATAFMDSLWAKQVGRRAIALTQMIATGQDPSNVST